jgi:hypothetical protein
MTYTPLVGETVYDVAARLYNDVPFGIKDILMSNKSIDLDNIDLSNVNITYTKGIKRKKPIFPFLKINISKDSEYIVKEYQSVYDLAIQLYGDVQRLPELITSFSNLNEPLPIGAKYIYKSNESPIRKYLLDRGVVISTFTNNEPIDPALITDDGFFIITDDEQNILP